MRGVVCSEPESNQVSLSLREAARSKAWSDHVLQPCYGSPGHPSFSRATETCCRLVPVSRNDLITRNPLSRACRGPASPVIVSVLLAPSRSDRLSIDEVKRLTRCVFAVGELDRGRAVLNLFRASDKCWSERHGVESRVGRDEREWRERLPTSRETIAVSHSLACMSRWNCSHGSTVSTCTSLSH